MLKQIMVPLLLCCLLGSSCSTSQEKTLLKKAMKVHEESASIEADFHLKLKELIQKKNSINIQGRALSTEELTFVDVIEKLENSYSKWKENYETSANLHALSNETAKGVATTDFLSKNKVNAKDIYSNQLELKKTISTLKEEVETTYEEWINEV